VLAVPTFHYWKIPSNYLTALLVCISLIIPLHYVHIGVAGLIKWDIFGSGCALP